MKAKAADEIAQKRGERRIADREDQSPVADVASDHRGLPGRRHLLYRVCRTHVQPWEKRGLLFMMIWGKRLLIEEKKRISLRKTH